MCTAYPIPEPFCWDESFCVFYENLDEQHKGLFKGIFDCAGDRSNSGALSGLLDRVKKHFATEEEMMKAKKYAEYDPHKQAHDEFVAKLSGLSCPLDDGAIHYAKEWLVNHIKGIDFKYKGKL